MGWLRQARFAMYRWEDYVPLVGVLKRYERTDFKHDVVAGCVVGMVTIPQAVAYALLAGMPPASGLYACLFPMLIYAIFGSAKQLVVGPVAVAALLVVASVSMHAEQYSDAYVGITTIVCMETAILLWLLRGLRMGGLVNLLSHPVITGFVNAAVILIIITQLPALTGLVSVRGVDSPLMMLLEIGNNLTRTDFWTTVFGAISLLFLGLFRPLCARLLSETDHPITRIGPMVLAAVAIIAVAVAPDNTITTIGAVPQGLPVLSWPPLDLKLWLALLPPAAIIAVVTYIESYSIGTSLAARHKSRIDPNQELIALGAANFGAALCSAYPVAGSFSRSGVNVSAGAKTPIACVVCAVVVAFVLLFLTDLFVYLPQVVLAAIVIVSVFGLIDLKSSPKHWALHKEDSLTEFVTFAAVLVLGVEVGLVCGVAASIAFFIRHSSRPNITQVGRLGDSEQFRSIKRYPVTTTSGVLALRVDENIYFANANQIETKVIKRVVLRKSTRHLLLVCSSVNMVDATGLMMLHRLNQHLANAGVTLSLSDIKGPLMQKLEATDLENYLSGSIFFTADVAMQALAASSE